MAVLPIIVAPDARLKMTSRPVARLDTEVRRLIDDMLETMYAAPGIGLSAIQVGVARRVIVADVAREGEPRAPLRLVNPELMWTSETTVSLEEGCLSLPEQYAEVVRPAEARVRYLDEHGAEREVHADGLLARCLQHELDHLEGVLFIDHLSSVRRNIILRKLAKARRGKALQTA